jgi:hypothetical protein
MQTTTLQNVESYSSEQVAAFKHDFDHDGYLLIPNVLSPTGVKEGKAI